MSFLRRWWRSSTASIPAVRNPPGPAPAILPIPPGGPNPIHQLLDDAGLPWREPRAAVEARIGISHDPIYDRDAVFFRDAVQPPGFLQPWRADLFERYAPDLPVVRFNALAWFADDAATNIHRTAELFAARLGPATIGQEYNTLACRWQAGAASLQLQSWPPVWQSRDLTNAAHGREPRSETACHVTLLTGFRLPPSTEEARWVAAFEPIADTRPFLRPMRGGLHNTAPGDTEVEYAREPPMELAALENRIGTTRARDALILCTHQLFVLSARDVLGFDVLRLLPAKGGGGSTLYVRCRTSCPAIDHKTLQIAQDDDPDGMVPLGQRLGALFDRPCEVGQYFDDV